MVVGAAYKNRFSFHQHYNKPTMTESQVVVFCNINRNYLFIKHGNLQSTVKYHQLCEHIDAEFLFIINR